MTNEELRDECVKRAMHCIGIGQRKMWRHHGYDIYLPYRNYYNCSEPDECWEKMITAGYAEKEVSPGGSIDYSLTPDGKQWLARRLRINICLTY